MKGEGVAVGGRQVRRGAAPLVPRVQVSPVIGQGLKGHLEFSYISSKVTQFRYNDQSKDDKKYDSSFSTF